MGNKQHLFSMVPQADIPRSSFNRSHGVKSTFDAGYLVPFFVDEVLPGDTFHARHHLFARLATPIRPIMDNMYMDVFYFAVPLRLIWDNFKKFMGEQKNPGDSTDFLVPQLVSPAGGWTVGSVADYFGLPTGVAGLSVSALPFRGLNLIFNEWFRDQNLQNSLPVPLGDGPDNNADYTLKRRGKRHDYFTSSLPWPQKGPGVNLPLGTTAPVYGTGKALGLATTGTNNYGLVTSSVMDTVPGTDEFVVSFSNAAYNSNRGTVISVPTGSPSFNYSMGVVQSGESGLYADLTTATAATINTLRQAFQLQKLYERDARGGTRYTELVRSHFGVTSPDARLQRPEYLGGSSSRIHINPVQQTSSTDATTPQGNLSAFGIVADSGNGFTKSFTEHSIIIGLVSVRADLSYQQGINRMWSRRTRYDFYWPALAHLGEQAVLSKEIYADGTANDANVFGYQERYAEYRYKPAQITGKMRSTFAQPLDSWHLGQKFTARPVLGDTFIQEDPPVARCIATPSEPHFLFDAFIDLQCARPMPVYGVPGMTDHF